MQISRLNLAFLTLKSLKHKKKMLSKDFFSQNFGKLFFYSIQKEFQVFKIAKFDIMIRVHYGLCAKYARTPTCDPLMQNIRTFMQQEYINYNYNIFFFSEFNSINGLLHP